MPLVSEPQQRSSLARVELQSDIYVCGCLSCSTFSAARPIVPLQGLGVSSGLVDAAMHKDGEMVSNFLSGGSPAQLLIYSQVRVCGRLIATRQSLSLRTLQHSACSRRRGEFACSLLVFSG